MPHEYFGEQGEPDENNGADERSHSEPHVKQEANADVKRNPRQVEECQRAGARKEIPNLIEIPKRQQPIVGAARLQCESRNGVVDAEAQALAKGPTDANQDATAQEVKNSLKSIK